MVAVVWRNNKFQNHLTLVAMYLNNKMIISVLLVSLTIILCYLNVLNRYYSSHGVGKINVVFYDDGAREEFQTFFGLGNNLQEFVSRSMADKCSVFSDALINNDWHINELPDLDYTVDALDSNRFFGIKFQGLNEDERKDPLKIKGIFNDLDQSVGKNKQIEALVSRGLSNIRVYDKCFIDGNLLNHECLDIESRLFPWLTFESPVFERWDGTVSKHWPNLVKFNKGKYPKYKQVKENGCFINVLKDNFRGRGIAISIGDQFKEEAVNLVAVMRHLGNELPIQFVHKGDLSFEVKTALIDAARNDIQLHDGSRITGYKQEVWFVDTKRCFREMDYKKFNKFSNKWLLVLFNSFDDMLLMDTDAVPFIKPEEFFELGEYPKLGLYFFKDRETKDKLHVGFDKLLVKLFPQDIESLLYGVEKVTEKTLNSNYFSKKSFHFMESGIVVLNKRKHLAGILTAIQLQFWHPVSKYTYGDKELFWLGQVLAGNEEFEFNTNHAAAIGELRRNDFAIADVVIGAQPAHIASDDHTLLWVNSGLQVCKRKTWKADFENIEFYKSKFKTEAELMEYYLDSIPLKSAVIPPSAIKRHPNDINEPEIGWAQRKDLGCDEYYWAAYSRVGPNTEDPETIGKIVSFNEEEVEKFMKLLRIWVRPKLYRSSDWDSISQGKSTDQKQS